MKKKLLLASEFEVIFPRPDVQDILKGYKKAVFIPTASYNTDYQTYFVTCVQKNFDSIGIESSLLEVSDKSFDEVTQSLEAHDIVYVGGGNTFYLLEKLNNCDFSKALGPFFEKGGLYIGSSAGAVVACPDIEFIKPMDEPEVVNLTSYQGLNLINLPIIVPHMDHKGYSAAAAQIISTLSHAGQQSYNLLDNQAVYVADDHIEML